MGITIMLPWTPKHQNSSVMKQISSAPGTESTATESGAASSFSITEGMDSVGSIIWISRLPPKKMRMLASIGTMAPKVSDKNGGTPSGILMVMPLVWQKRVTSTETKATMMAVNRPCAPR